MADGNLNDTPEKDLRQPINIDAEQAILGAILFDNEVFYRVSNFLQAEHFHDSVHQLIYETCSSLISSGRTASPVTLATHLSSAEGLQEIGGKSYLQSLLENVPAIASAPEYARVVFDLAVSRGLMMLGSEMMERARRTAVDDDPQTQVEEAEQALYKLAESGKYGGGFKTFAVALREAVDMAEAAFKRDGGLSGITTGLMDMDRRLGGLHPSDLLILAGRPSMGKTALATNIAVNAAKAYRDALAANEESILGGPVGLFSLEMSAEQLATRIMSEFSEVPSDKIRRGDVTQDEFAKIYDAAKFLESLPLHIDDTGGISIAQLAARCRRLKRQHGLGFVVVDYLQLVTGSKKTSENRVQEISEITMGLKSLAKELSVPVLALSQLSRQVENREDKRPQLADLRESGSIEQDADVVMFVYREEYYLSRTEPREGTPEHAEWITRTAEAHGIAEVIIGKQRHGPIGTVRLAFDANIVKFGNLAMPDRYGDHGF